VALLTGGNVHDSTMFAPLLAALTVARSDWAGRAPRPEHLIADKGYSSQTNRRLLRARGIAHTVPEKAVRAVHRRGRGSAGGRPPSLDPNRYACRADIERCFGRLKQWRGLTTRYDKHACNYAGAITLAALLT